MRLRIPCFLRCAIFQSMPFTDSPVFLARSAVVIFGLSLISAIIFSLVFSPILGRKPFAGWRWNMTRKPLLRILNSTRTPLCAHSLAMRLIPEPHFSISFDLKSTLAIRGLRRIDRSSPSADDNPRENHPDCKSPHGSLKMETSLPFGIR